MDAVEGARRPFDADASDAVLENESECRFCAPFVGERTLSSNVDRATRVDVVEGAAERVL